MCGFKVVELKSAETGLVDIDRLKSMLSERTAACMLTNPNTLGLFEKDILTITDLVHEAGGLMYYDGANLNAIMGQTKPAEMGFDVMHINTHKTFATPHGGGGPGSGPVAAGKTLMPFLPVPLVEKEDARYFLNWDLPDTMGKVKTFYGNFEMMIRALTYILAYGSEGLTQVSRDAVLNANYLKERLKSAYHVPYPELCKHEFILTSKLQKAQDSHLNTMVLVKRLMDFGIHPPTVYFPLIVAEAMMIEPTETESKKTLDQFVAVMLQIAEECRENPEVVLSAPQTTPVQRVDEVAAARYPDLNFYHRKETAPL
jgi:glycine dehydrogenase subunit 2